jgi:hypothetical protein
MKNYSSTASNKATAYTLSLGATLLKFGLMFNRSGGLVCAFFFAFRVCAFAGPTPEQIKQLPQPADHTINFENEIKPIFDSSCINCHGRGREKGGLKIDTRETLLKGGDSGLAVVSGKSGESLLISLVAGLDPDSVMPKKGSRLTPQQIGLLRAWIDQGLQWDPKITFARPEPNNLKPRMVELPKKSRYSNPIDQLLETYFASNSVKVARVVDDRTFARRVWLDTIGLLPEPAVFDRFLTDKRKNKRELLVKALLARNRDYAENWLTFWNDMLRNDYRGAGYIDGGRKQITKWLYSSLLTNMPYNEFVAELINPRPDSEGFTKGIVWRGVVNASQTPQMQAAQSICQVFMGVNLKCASCHDSFINDLTLADSYGLAGIYADAPLEMVRCDVPSGKTAELKFIYSQLGAIDSKADKAARLKELADIITGPKDGRLTRTLVNRLWERFFGRGLVEPVDDMEKAAWDPDVLDWLAQDFTSSGYDVKHLIEIILTSRAYQLPAVTAAPDKTFVFQGPAVRRMSAEQFRDSLTELTGWGYPAAAADVPGVVSKKRDFNWSIPVRRIWNAPKAADKTKPATVYFLKKFSLDATPPDATAVVSCDNTFKLFVNGKKLGSGNDFTAVYVFDLKPALKSGTNVIAIEGVNLGREDKASPDQSNPAGLMFYSRIRSAKGKNHDLGSDATWLASETNSPEWLSGAHDESWKPAVDLGDMSMAPWRTSKEQVRTKLAAYYPGEIRAALVPADALMVALGRPSREQVVTVRSSEATTLQALELTNGKTLADILREGATALQTEAATHKNVVQEIYKRALGRKPTGSEAKVAQQLTGKPATTAGVADLLWAVAMLPEYQLIY